MLTNLRRSIVLSLLFLGGLGLAYPLAGTGVAQLVFRHQADGSLTADGSTIIGQSWTGPRWFHGRPSATVNVSTAKPEPYNAMSSGASNLGPRSQTLEKTVAQRAAALRQAGVTPTEGLVTSSASGLDPDISPADAKAQIAAVAAARQLPVAEVQHLVATHVQQPELGFLGEPVVDVLQLNQALARLH